MADRLKYETIPQCTTALIDKNEVCKAPNDRALKRVELSEDVTCIVENIGQIFDFRQQRSPEGLLHQARISNAVLPPAGTVAKQDVSRINVFLSKNQTLKNYGAVGIYYGILQKDGKDTELKAGSVSNIAGAQARVGFICMDVNRDAVVPLINAADAKKLAKTTIQGL